MNILNRYFWQEAGSSILMIMLGLLAMFSFFDLIQELDSLGQGNYGISKMLVFVLLSIPGHIYEVMPIAVLVGMMFTLGTLGRNSELVVMRVSGMSLGKIGVSLLKIGLIFTLITFLIGEMIAPISEKMAQRMRIKATDSVVAQDFQSGLWIKDDKSFVNVATVLPDASLLGIQIYEFDDQFRLKRVRRAEKGVHQDKEWALTNVTQTVFLTEKKVENNSVVTEKFKYANWESPIRW